MYADDSSGGMNIPNFKLKSDALYLMHLYKLISNHEANWTYFAKYWKGIHLRKLNASFASNLVPHSDYVPLFYRECLTVFDNFLELYPDFLFDRISTQILYNLLLKNKSVLPKVYTIFPTINFNSLWKNIYLPCIDPSVQKTMFKLCHDVIYVKLLPV